MKRSILLDQIEDKIIRTVLEELFDAAVDANQAAYIARQSIVTGGGGSGQPNEPPPPFDPRVAQADRGDIQ